MDIITPPSINQSKITINKEYFTKVSKQNFHGELTQIKGKDIISFLENNFSANILILKNINSLNALRKQINLLNTTKNIILTENIFLQMLQDTKIMYEMYLKIFNSFNNPSILTKQTILILLPDGTIAYWPFSTAEYQSLLKKQNAYKQDARTGFFKRLNDLSKKRHRQIRKRNWLTAYAETNKTEKVVNPEIIDELTKLKNY